METESLFPDRLMETPPLEEEISDIEDYPMEDERTITVLEAYRKLSKDSLSISQNNVGQAANQANTEHVHPEFYTDEEGAIFPITRLPNLAKRSSDEFVRSENGMRFEKMELLIYVLKMVLISLWNFLTRMIYGEGYFKYKERRDDIMSGKFSWHAHLNEFYAVTPGDRKVRVFKYVKGQDGFEVDSDLRSGGGLDVIRCVSYRPNSSNTLASAGKRHVTISKAVNRGEDNRNGPFDGTDISIDGTATFSRHSFSEVLLGKTEYKEADLLSWSPDGLLLAVGGRFSRSVLIYDHLHNSELWLSKTASGISSLEFSPSGDYLAIGGLGFLDIFETRLWKRSHWNLPKDKNGRKSFCNNLCWTSGGRHLFVFQEGHSSFLVFSVKSQIMREPLSFQPSLRSIEYSQKEDLASAFAIDAPIGIIQAALDGNRARLAISFSSPRLPEIGGNVMLYSVSLRDDDKYMFNVIGLVRSVDSHIPPRHVAFKPAFGEGSVLTIVSGEGNLHLIPLLY